MDSVFINGLRAESVIGTYEWERAIRQSLTIDLEMACNMAAAGQSDDLDDALDYAAVAREVVALVEGASFELLEALAEAIAQHILDHFAVKGVVLTVTKPSAVPLAEAVGVRIKRGFWG